MRRHNVGRYVDHRSRGAKNARHLLLHKCPGCSRQFNTIIIARARSLVPALTNYYFLAIAYHCACAIVCLWTLLSSFRARVFVRAAQCGDIISSACVCPPCCSPAASVFSLLIEIRYGRCACCGLPPPPMASERYGSPWAQTHTECAHRMNACTYAGTKTHTHSHNKPHAKSCHVKIIEQAHGSNALAKTFDHFV